MITSLEQVTESRLCWPETKPRSTYRKRSPFRNREAATATRAIEMELERWRVKQFIISRNNQRIFSGDPGAAAWWVDPRKKDLRVLACDRWDKLADNLHAIAQTLDAMRALERWGAYTMEQAAEGARLALPPPGDAPLPPWWATLGVEQNWPLPAIEGMYRDMAKRHAGDEGKLRSLNLAIESARKAKA